MFFIIILNQNMFQLTKNPRPYKQKYDTKSRKVISLCCVLVSSRLKYCIQFRAFCKMERVQGSASKIIEGLKDKAQEQLEILSTFRLEKTMRRHDSGFQISSNIDHLWSRVIIQNNCSRLFQQHLKNQFKLQKYLKNQLKLQKSRFDQEINYNFIIVRAI